MECDSSRFWRQRNRRQFSFLTNSSELGFTLVEVALAVAIAGAALVTLVALQTRLLTTVVDERIRIDAALVSQYMMTMIELHPEELKPGSTKGRLNDKLQQMGFFTDKKDDPLKEKFKDWSFALEITSMDFPPLKDVLRHVDFSVKWSPLPADSYSLAYDMTPQKKKGNSPSLDSDTGGDPEP